MTTFYGSINWWGFSPALDLQETGFQEMCKKLICAAPEELNILIVGAGDVRHILKTVAHRYRHTKRKLKFYVIETALELYARDILLMMVALEKQQNMGLQDKAELFLELYGNTLVRHQSSQYVENMSHELIKMITDFDYMEKKLPFLDLTQLKYKERDFLEGILKFWRNKEKQLPLDISKCWDLRLRQLLGVRYDSRLNVFDWDYNMELIERGGSIIYVRQYKNWRNDGVAFKIREGTYDVPNRTLASGMVFKLDGERYPRRGYWGDMLVSPYVTFGIETEDKSFYKKQNNTHTKTAEDVSEFNIISLFYEIANGERYQPPKVELPKVVPEIVSSKLQEISEEDAEEDQSQMETRKEDRKEEMEQQENKTDITKGKSSDFDVKDFVESENDKDDLGANGNNSNQNNDKTDYDWLLLDDIKIVFLPLGSAEELVKKNKYSRLFNIVYFSNSSVHHLKPEISQLFADKCCVVLETALFMLDIKKDNVTEFVKKISGFASAAGCKPLETWNDLQDSYIKFYYER